MAGSVSAPCHESEPTPDTAGVPGLRDRMAQRPRIEPNTIGEKNVNVMMPNDIMLYSID